MSVPVHAIPATPVTQTAVCHRQTERHRQFQGERQLWKGTSGSQEAHKYLMNDGS